ncbi:MAG: hypothetical protein JSW71_21980 [Gemmatimonadota bacterium]|nr:MAG: hypothetical protein JSW71_21980 [Gemmatimonadota bacterium]
MARFPARDAEDAVKHAFAEAGGSTLLVRRLRLSQRTPSPHPIPQLPYY